MASILVLGVKVPFTSGGQEVLVASLVKQLKARGHDVDTVELPYSPVPKENLALQGALWRATNLDQMTGRKIDLVIATKFPSYYIKHACKSVWLVHQHRAIYDLYSTRFSDFGDDPRDEALREMLSSADRLVLGEAAYRAAISANVANRLKIYNGLEAETLYPPLPLSDRYSCKEQQDYILSVGRICSIKRVDLMIKALPLVSPAVKLKVAGVADEPGILDYLQSEIRKHHLQNRVEFLGRVNDSDLLDLYSNCLAVYYGPHNEDYGYVTLEAMASSKPVISCEDSGGVLEFIRDGETGLILKPESQEIGRGVNKLVENLTLAKDMGQAGRKFIDANPGLSAGWEHVVNRLTSPLGARY